MNREARLRRIQAAIDVSRQRPIVARHEVSYRLPGEPFSRTLLIDAVDSKEATHAFRNALGYQARKAFGVTVRRHKFWQNQM